MHLFKIHRIKRALTICALAVTASFTASQQAHAQDLLARQANIERKIRAVDSVTINRAVEQKRRTNLGESEIYTTWNTEKVHCYSSAEVPEHYRIDLRGFCMPTPSRVITSNFGWRPSFGRMHKGLDIKVYIGDTIVSAFDGRVRIVNYEANGYGNYIVVRHSNGLETIYGHLSKHLCKVGDVVRAGQPIGLGGNTGRSTGSHLHFETRIAGEAINPALLFDFVAQDVTGDYYDFTRANNGRSTAAPAVANNSAASAASQMASAGTTAQPPRGRGDGKVYKVKKGDTLYSIAQNVGISVDELCSRNRGLKKNGKLKVGQIIRY